jgi:hypothetical protein
LNTDTLAELKRLKEKANECGLNPWSSPYAAFIAALVNAADDLLDAAERDAGMCPMIDAEPERVIVTGRAHGGCLLRHALEVRPDATFDPRSLYVRSDKIAALAAEEDKLKGGM